MESIFHNSVTYMTILCKAVSTSLTMHIVIDFEKMITEISHRKSLWQLDCIRKYLTEEQCIIVQRPKTAQNMMHLNYTDEKDVIINIYLQIMIF